MTRIRIIVRAATAIGLAAAVTALTGCPYPDVPGCVDEDGDGYGNPANYFGGCPFPETADCDDTDPAIHPGADQACDDVLDNDCDGVSDLNEIDEDGDGFSACQLDCDDTDGDVNPSATEVCNAIDDNCDDAIDEGFDQDQDSHSVCGADGISGTEDDDCDDTDDSIFPGATEYCDGADNDCDGDTDEAEDIEYLDYYPDADEDGFGDESATAVNDCAPVDGHVTDASDCDDTDDTVYPAADELCDGLDNDCDGVTPADEDDGDGDGVRICEDDCDDADDTSHPGATELCDGIDNDCDGTVPADEDDGDGDTHRVCDGDCDDTRPTVYPGAAELCDEIDNDCDGSAGPDEVDGDGDGWMICANDCNDADATILPGADELCDGLDNDCDAVLPVDEVDNDGDGHVECLWDGNGWDGDVAVVGDQDCDDTDAANFPGNTEECDGYDNDCDSSVPADEVDGDGDGHRLCDGDCDDGDATVYPGGFELCDGIDNNCGGAPMENEIDDDGDGYVECVWDAGGWDGDPAVVGGEDCNDIDPDNHPGNHEACDGADNDCDGSPGPDEFDDDGDGVTECDGDCDDINAATYPGATELCDGIDNDCSGFPDADELTDADGDGVSACADCDDNDASMLEDDCVLAMASARIIGDMGLATLGYGFAPVEDSNGDGYDELLVGVPGGGNNIIPGAAYLFEQPVSGLIEVSDAAASWTGEDINDMAGAAVDSAGDLDNDGFTDLIIAAKNHDVGYYRAGFVYVLYGPHVGHQSLAIADGTVYGRISESRVGESVSGVGDVDGDGNDDIVIGAHHTRNIGGTDVGAAYVLRGPVLGDIALTDAAGNDQLGPDDAVFWGSNFEDRAGAVVSGRLDFNNDGFDDVIVAVNDDDFGGTNTGAAYVLYGPTSGEHLLHDVYTAGIGVYFWGEASNDYASQAIGPAGDVNGDGFDDLLVGARYHNNRDGAAYLVLGSNSAVPHSLGSADVRLYGDAGQGDNAGYSTVGAGDMDGDQFGDLIVGAYAHNDYGGAVYLVAWDDIDALGSFDLSAVATHTLHGSTDLGTGLGLGARYLGDVDGDTLPDYAFCGYQEDSSTGAVYQVVGADLP